MIAIPSARSEAQCSGGCRLQVTPNGTGVSWTANTSGHTASFTVKSVSSVQESGSLSCAVTGPVTCTNTSPSSYSLSPGQQIPVTVTYSVGNPGSGTLTLNAYYGTGFS